MFFKCRVVCHLVPAVWFVQVKADGSNNIYTYKKEKDGRERDFSWGLLVVCKQVLNYM